jgi:hypothetical protein
MNKIVKIAFLFFISFLTIQAQPNLLFEGGNMYDWGNVKPDDSPLKAKVKILNKGNDTLKILKVQPGCGCTTAPIDKDKIEPGGFATLDITFDVHTASGVINKNIKIQTNNEMRPIDMYYLRANVVRPASFVGENYFNFGTISVGKDYTKEVKIHNNSGKEIKIDEILKVPDYCKLNIEKGSIIPVDKDYTLKAIINLKNPGIFSFSIKIKTDQSKEPDLFISGWGVANP